MSPLLDGESKHPALTLGETGDFFDFIPFESGSLGLLIADVTDKGMPAALFMAMTRSILRSSLQQAGSIAEGITKANTLICTDSTIGMPVTLFYGFIAPQDDRMIYVNAGHNPPLLYKLDQAQPSALTRTGMLMGFLDDAAYEQVSIQVAPGDFLVFYTDGITDATNADQESYGMQRFRDSIQENRAGSAQQILAGIKNAVQDYIGATPPYDDITLLVARRL